MPKRKKAKNLQKEQPTHTPHPHNKITPKFPRMPPKFRQNHDCTLQVSHVHRCQVSARSNLHPEVSQCAKIRGFGLSKTTHQVSTYPTKHPEVSQCAKIRGFGLPKTTLQVSTYPTMHPEVSQCAKTQGFGLSKTTLQVSFYS